MNSDAIRALACQGLLPKILVRANLVKCASCQVDKARIKSASKKGKLTDDLITKPGDLIHMNQA